MNSVDISTWTTSGLIAALLIWLWRAKAVRDGLVTILTRAHEYIENSHEMLEVTRKNLAVNTNNSEKLDRISGHLDAMNGKIARSLENIAELKGRIG